MSHHKKTVVLMNLGGALDSNGVQDFLFQLFNDPFILPYSRFPRWLLAQLISRVRKSKTQAIYRSISPVGGSPIYQNTLDQAQALEALMGCKVFVAMRYAPPFIHNVVREVYATSPDEIILVPLYPQYSMTTTQPALQAWFQASSQYELVPTRWIPYFYDHPLFLQSYADLIRPFYEEASAYGKPKILLSSHGLPVSLVAKGDPYPVQVQAGGKALAEILGCDVDVCYQSRVGPKKWLEPSLGQALEEAGRLGSPVVVVPFAFVSEHSETLYELDIEYKEFAHKCGVPYYGRVPALGSYPPFVELLSNLVSGCH